MLVLGVVHFFNLFLFTRIRRRQAAPPIPPTGYVGAQ
jgi:hypothetical protein